MEVLELFDDDEEEEEEEAELLPSEQLLMFSSSSMNGFGFFSAEKDWGLLKLSPSFAKEDGPNGSTPRSISRGGEG